MKIIKNWWNNKTGEDKEDFIARIIASFIVLSVLVFALAISFVAISNEEVVKGTITCKSDTLNLVDEPVYEVTVKRGTIVFDTEDGKYVADMSNCAVKLGGN